MDTASASTTYSTAPTPNPTIAPFDTGLNGVNQAGNLFFKDVMWWSLGIIALAILTVRIGEILWAHLRLVTAMALEGRKQGYWRVTQWQLVPSIKKNITYAPLWRKRHNREIRLSAALNVGTLPSRLHALILLLYTGSNFCWMFWLDWARADRYSVAAELRGRAGTLAAVNLVPLVILAGRNNPLIRILKISFDTYNLIHRWLGRCVVLEIGVHASAWAFVQVAAGGWPSIGDKITHDRFIASGFVGALCLLAIGLASLSPLRHAFYETFLNAHIALALTVFVCTWVHCASSGIAGGLPQLPWIIAVAILWTCERLARMLRLAWCNWSRRGFTEAVVEPLPGATCRVTMHLPRHVDVRPGTHAYLRFAEVNPWESHPFSIAWVEHRASDETLPLTEKLPRSGGGGSRATPTSVSFVIGAQTGLTRKLYEMAERSARPGRPLRLRAAFEGPYAGHHALDSYGTAVLIAGATGITHQMGHLRHLVEGYGDGTVATRRVVLVWVVRDAEMLEWVRPWMDTILRLPKRKEILNVKLFITRPKNPREVFSASETVQMRPGRPNIPTLLKKEVVEQVGAMCVTVCGPGALADDVRAAVREVQGQGTVVDFIEESFTW